MLTPHCSAASGMVVPPSIVPTTRLRKSSEYGFAIHAGLLPVGSLNHIRAGLGIPDSAFSGNALRSATSTRRNSRIPMKDALVELIRTKPAQVPAKEDTRKAAVQRDVVNLMDALR